MVVVFRTRTFENVWTKKTGRRRSCLGVCVCENRWKQYQTATGAGGGNDVSLTRITAIQSFLSLSFSSSNLLFFFSPYVRVGSYVCSCVRVRARARVTYASVHSRVVRVLWFARACLTRTDIYLRFFFPILVFRRFTRVGACFYFF